jgi:hypothetical protein
LQCQEDLIEFCGKQKIDFILHGHRHQPHFRQMICPNGHQVYILASGSLSHRFPTYVYGTISNQFHLIALHERDSSQISYKGELSSYSFSQVQKWRPSQHSSDGIHGKIPFGPYVSPAIVFRDIKPKITERIEDKGMCFMHEIRSFKDYIKYLTPDVLNGVLLDICADLNLMMIGNEQSEVVILKAGPL